MAGRRRWIQPLFFMGLFSCWLWLGALCGGWLLASERQTAQLALDEYTLQQQHSLQAQIDQLQRDAWQLLLGMERASQAGRVQPQPYLASLRQRYPVLEQLVLLADHGVAGQWPPGEEAGQAPGLLPSGQALLRQPQLAAALPTLQPGQAQWLLWQRRSPERLLLLLPGRQGWALALWLSPRALLPDTLPQATSARLSAQPAAPLAAIQDGNLFSQQTLRCGTLQLNLTLWRSVAAGEALSWRLPGLVLFMLLSGWLGWQSWRQSRRTLRRVWQAQTLQAQWLGQAAQLTPVSPQRALATLERQLQHLAPERAMVVWWVHGKGLRRRHFHLASAMFRLENQLAQTPYTGLQPVRLRHGGMLLVLEQPQATLAATTSHLSYWLTAVLGGRHDEASLLWRSFDLRHGVGELERVLTDPYMNPLYSAAQRLLPQR